MAVAAVASGRSRLAEYAGDAGLARLGALVIDLLALGLVTTLANAVYGVDQPNGSRTVGIGALTVIWILYFMVPEAMFGASLGKLRMRLRVVRVDGRPLDLTAVIVRNLLRAVDLLPVLYLLGGASVLLTGQSQRLGDLAAGTTVVYRHRASELGGTLHPTPLARGVLVFSLAAAVVFTVAFQYFGRPALEIQGLFNTGRLIPVTGVATYELGRPQWSLGRVTYPVITTGSTPAAHCSGTITLQWDDFFWTTSQASYTCGVS